MSWVSLRRRNIIFSTFSALRVCLVLLNVSESSEKALSDSQLVLVMECTTLAIAERSGNLAAKDVKQKALHVIPVLIGFVILAEELPSWRKSLY